MDEDTGELHGRQLTPRRLRTIFDTNIQSSYNAGRYQQQMANVADRPYFERVAVMDLHTRPKHAALNGFTAGRMTLSGSISTRRTDTDAAAVSVRVRRLMWRNTA